MVAPGPPRAAPPSAHEADPFAEGDPTGGDRHHDEGPAAPATAAGRRPCRVAPRSVGVIAAVVLLRAPAAIRGSGVVVRAPAGRGHAPRRWTVCWRAGPGAVMARGAFATAQAGSGSPRQGSRPPVERCGASSIGVGSSRRGLHCRRGGGLTTRGGRDPRRRCRRPAEGDPSRSRAGKDRCCTRPRSRAGRHRLRARAHTVRSGGQA